LFRRACCRLILFRLPAAILLFAGLFAVSIPAVAADDLPAFQEMLAREKPPWWEAAREGNRLWEEGDREGAVMRWEEAVKAGFKDGQVYYYLGIYFHQQGRGDKAFEYLRQAAAHLERARGEPAIQVEIYNLLGEVYLERKDIGQALVCFRKAIRLDQNYAPSYLELSRVHLLRGELQLARQAVLKALELDGDLYSAWWVLARISEACGEYVEAANYYRHFLEQEPRRWDARLSLAVILFAYLRLPDEAESELERVLIDNPSAPAAHAALSAIWMDRGEKVRAREKASEALALDPSNYQALITLGQVFLEEVELDRAEEYFRKALSSESRPALAYHGLAVVALRREDYAAAEKLLRAALEIAPGFSSAAYNLSLALELTGRREEAINLLRQLVSRDSAFQPAHTALGKIYYRSGNRPEAVAFLRNAVALTPRDWEPYYFLGKTYFDQGDYSSARDYFLRAQQMAPENPALAVDLGLTYERLGRLEEAEQVLVRAREIAPGYLPAVVQLALFQTRRRRFSQARDLYRQAVITSSDEMTWRYQGERGEFILRLISDLEEHLSSGMDYLALCQLIGLAARDQYIFPELVQILEKKIESDPINPRYHHLLGLVRQEMGDLNKAEEHYRRALQLDSGLAPAHFSLGRLYAEQNRPDLARRHLETFKTLLPDSPLADTVEYIIRSLPEPVSPASAAESLDRV